jgi:ABC-type glutathione transport system ATPase component
VLSDVDLTVRRGEILGIIGETGSGKTTLARAIVGLVPARSGRICFEGAELSALRGRRLRDFRRGGRLQFAFQDPLRALDPELAVAAIVGEPLTIAGTVDRAERAARVAEALRAVGLDAALTERLPGQLSGGQRQRVLLARALVTRPALLIADEPVSALDAANRNHVLRLLADLRDASGTTVAVISHDLHSLAGIADRVAVLHQGRIAEHGPVREVLDRPQHPYTIRLVAAAPRLRRERLAVTTTTTT